MWQAPQTNWRTGDFYNWEDWQRLAQNFAFLAALAKEKGAGLTLSALPEYDRSAALTAADLNRAEANYAACRSFVAGESYRPETHYAGGSFWPPWRLNDMEKAQQKAKEKLERL